MLNSKNTDEFLNNSEEIILLNRESEKYEKIKEKEELRKKFYIEKLLGYNCISKKDEKMIKILLGFLLELELINDEKIMDKVILSVFDKTILSKSTKILNLEEISYENIYKILIE